MTKQPCLPHPDVLDWVRRRDKTDFGLLHSFEAAITTLEDLDIPPASRPGQRQQAFRYRPSAQVPGAYELILLFEIEGPYVNIQGVGVPLLGIKFIAAVVR